MSVAMTYDRVGEISRRLRSSAPSRDLAAEYGLPYGCLLAAVRQRVPVPDDQADYLSRAVSMFRAGATIAEIARHVDRDRAGVMRRLRGHGYDVADRPPPDMAVANVGEAVREAKRLHAAGELMVDIVASVPAGMRDDVCRAIYVASLCADPMPRFGQALSADLLSRYRAGDHARTLADEHGVAMSAMVTLLKAEAGLTWPAVVQANRDGGRILPRGLPIP